MTDFLAVHVNAGNDVNGNPRRGTMITTDTGFFHDFLEHGYRGERQALRDEGYTPFAWHIPRNQHVPENEPNPITELGTLDITYRQYRSLVKLAQEVKTQA